MSTALAVSKPQLTPDAFQMIMNVAPVMHTGRLFGTKSVEGAAGIMIKGWELGFSLSASFENLVEIEGKIALVPKGALALIYGSPECAAVKIVDEADSKGVPTGCAVTMKRRNGLEYTARFTMDDARRADLVKPKSGWEKYPANMLRWRAIGFCADIVFPDVIGGTKRADEFGADLTPDGDVIEGSWQVQPQTVSQPDPQSRLNSLIDIYGPQAIIDANGGRIPATNDELDSIERKLGGQ